MPIGKSEDKSRLLNRDISAHNDDDDKREGRVFTISNISLANGVVYFVDGWIRTTLDDLWDARSITVKAGETAYPQRTRNLALFAAALGLLRVDGQSVEITSLGRDFVEAQDRLDKWKLTKKQKKLLRKYMEANPDLNETIYAISSLRRVLQENRKAGFYTLKGIFCKSIGKESKWKSDVTRTDYLRFCLNYLDELGYQYSIPFEFAPTDSTEPRPENSGHSTIEVENPLEFKIGSIRPRKQIHDTMGGQRYGGISTPRKCNAILLFSCPRGRRHGYHDGWTEGGIYLYTGEGQKGDMKLHRGNDAILNHAKSNKILLLFEDRGKGLVEFVGRMTCIGHQIKKMDSQGRSRRVVVFQLSRSQEEDGNYAKAIQIDNDSSVDLHSAPQHTTGPLDNGIITKESSSIWFYYLDKNSSKHFEETSLHFSEKEGLWGVPGTTKTFRQLKRFKQIQAGDLILFMSQWKPIGHGGRVPLGSFGGILGRADLFKVVTDYYYDSSKVWYEIKGWEGETYPHRFRFDNRPLVHLENIPIGDLTPETRFELHRLFTATLFWSGDDICLQDIIKHSEHVVTDASKHEETKGTRSRSSDSGGGARRRSYTRKPASTRILQFADKTVPFIHSKEIPMIVASELIASGELDEAKLPWGPGKKRYLISTTPLHPSGRGFFAPVRLSNGWWLETHSNESTQLRLSRGLMKHCGRRNPKVCINSK